MTNDTARAGLPDLRVVDDRYTVELDQAGFKRGQLAGAGDVGQLALGRGNQLLNVTPQAGRRSS